MKRFIVYTLLAFILFPLGAKADEGMWLPMLIQKYNFADMQSKGFKLTAEDIYSINQPSIKDAIVIFGGGCTGEVISPEGLLITNHHCGYGNIQKHSSIEHDYLTNGFWAMSRSEELPNPGLTVSFLVRMDDVTQKALAGVTNGMTESQRVETIKKNSDAISKEVTEGTHYSARVTPMYNGNQYFVFIYEIFTDVRLVGAPPSNVGKFGGDTDNWMWPRHTGDFSMFRIYADKDNKPAEYSADNVPYTPKRHLPISLKGVEPNDFTMVYGYPGTTQQFVTSQVVDEVVNISNPLKISLRDVRLEIMENYMRQNDTVRIQYASKQAGVANAWKKWQGERNGLIRLDAINKKQNLESDFNQWVSQDSKRTKEYGHLLNRFSELYAARKPLLVANDLGREAFMAVELIRFVSQFNSAIKRVLTDKEISEKMQESLVARTRGFYKDYYQPIDKEIFAEMMKTYAQILPDSLQPSALKQLVASSDDNWSVAANTLFGESIFTDSTLVINALADFTKENAGRFKNDMAFQLFAQHDSIFAASIDSSYREINQELDLLYRTYIKGLMEMQPNKTFSPDANFTLRVTYGKIEGYFPSDGVEYTHLTTLDGVAEKAQMGVYDYVVPEKLLKLQAEKDYGRWEVNGSVPVCFLASNHTSGGNSGSPVINAEGHLVGINFDRVWEGTMSDIMFDPNMCRNISIDIRYALFIIDKYAGATHLLNEMTLIE
ncbi:MAG: S46 family peptidase [Tenuifilaceae bacterium]|nr:S46 family peptidase [Tenuifilaceae bacterium]